MTNRKITTPRVDKKDEVYEATQAQATRERLEREFREQLKKGNK